MPDNEILQQILAEMKNINERLEKLEKVTLETSETIKELNKTMKHTDKTVQVLSHRSIEHEAVLQEIYKDVY